jgi:hypothetical protein
MRTKLTCTGKPRFDLCCHDMKKELEWIDKMDWDPYTTYTFQYAEEVPQDNPYCTTHLHCHIHGTPYSKMRVVERVGPFRIMRYPHTFFQTDRRIREELYPIVSSFLQDTKNVFFLGGECYVFPFFAPPFTEVHIISDFPSIVEDAKYNHPQHRVDLVSYDHFRCTDSYDRGIINVSHDLPDSVWESMDCDSLLVIRCRPRKVRPGFVIEKTWTMLHVVVELCKKRIVKSEMC